MRLRISHRTSYRYAEPIARGLQLVRLFPSAHAGLSALSWNVAAAGGRVGRSFLDGYANRTALVDLDEGTTRVEIRVDGLVETRGTNAILENAAEALPPAYYLRSTELTAPDEAIRGLMKPARADYETAIALMHAVRDRVDFQAGVTDVTAPAGEALARGAGVCQDHAHIMLAAARARGLPARYVSGYIFAGDSHVASHAWTEAFTENGWLGLDPANRALVDEAYVRLACGLDYREASPVAGVRIGGAEETMNVAVEVRDQQ